jgi:predicted PhzF superfamily epimerase YddE/YHI9
MRVSFYQLDAFATHLFAGNPAAVMLLPAFPADTLLQAVAAENNLAETAFLVPQGADYRLRWFTPLVEVPLCGHATLASAAVVMERLEPGRDNVTFDTASGPLRVARAATGYVMDLPARPAAAIARPPALTAALGTAPAAVLVNAFNYMAVYDDADTVRALAPDMAAIARLDRPGVIVTAPGDGGYDIVSRYFAPAKGIPEDPVTGGAHCMLAPYWCDRLATMTLRAFQASRRGGEIACRLAGERVELAGGCIFYLEGMAEIGE